MTSHEPRLGGRYALPCRAFFPAISNLLTFGICGLLAGCAAQSPPRPPRVERPVAVRDLAATQVGTDVDLSFTLPDRAEDGQGLSKPVEIDLLRAAVHRGETPAPAAAPDLLIALRGTALARHTSGGKVEYRDAFEGAQFPGVVGDTLIYQVRGLTRGFRGRAIEADLSNAATVRVLDVPRPLTGLAVEATASTLLLRWSEPAMTVSGKPVAVRQYRIYRSMTGQPGSYQPIGESPDPTFADAGFEFGQRYSYRVRALVTDAGETAESADSATVEIVPRDVFPPAVPAGLTGLYTAGGVELVWSPNPEPNLAGYNVYRRTAGGQAAKLNVRLQPSPRYRDAAVTPGVRYTYRITAVDMSGNESAPSGDVSVDVP